MPNFYLSTRKIAVVQIHLIWPVAPNQNRRTNLEWEIVTREIQDILPGELTLNS